MFNLKVRPRGLVRPRIFTMRKGVLYIEVKIWRASARLGFNGYPFMGMERKMKGERYRVQSPRRSDLVT